MYLCIHAHTHTSTDKVRQIGSLHMLLQASQKPSLPPTPPAPRLCSLFSVGVLLLWGVFYTSGLVAYAVYSDCDPLTAGKIQKADQIIPYLVADKLSHLTGLTGLFVAAVYGGVLR